MKTLITNNPLPIWIGNQIARSFTLYYIVVRTFERLTQPFVVLRFRRQLNRLDTLPITAVLAAHKR